MGYKLNTPICLSFLANKFNCRLLGDDIVVTSISSFDNAKKSDITFTKELNKNISGLAIVTKMPSDDVEIKDMGVLIADNPRLTFIKILDFLVRDIGFATWDEAPVIDSTASIGNNVVIENGCVIGANSIIEHNVVLHSGTRIGKHCRIRSCSSIGGDGFGFERLEDGSPLRFPHLGGVIIGDNVEIGSCTAIARGTLSDTIIEDNVKVDNLVHIAHNCWVKNGAFIIACAELSGGVVIGQNAWIAPNSCTHQKISIGDHSLVGLGAVVTKNVPENTVVAGNPAKRIRSTS